MELRDCLNSRRSSSPQPIILRVIVALSSTESKTLDVYAGEDPEDSALRFLRENNLPADALHPLTKHIQSHIQKHRDDARMTWVRHTPRDDSAPHRPMICPKSEKLCNKSRNNTPVQDRLLQWKQEKSTQQEMKRAFTSNVLQPVSMNIPSSQRSSICSHAATTPRGSSVTAGERMYKQAINHQKRQDKAREQAEAIRIEKEAQEAVFRPKITSMAQSMQNRRPLHQGHGPSHDLKKMQLERENEQRMLQECTFKPNVNRQQSTNSRTFSGASRFDILYADSERRKLAKDILQN
eukprot:PhF_6_TR38855/c0_g1_i1/m.58105